MKDENLLPAVRMSWIVYLIEKRGQYYTGITTNLPHRLRQHQAAVLKFSEPQSSRQAAAARERQIKGWSRAKKEGLWTTGSR